MRRTFILLPKQTFFLIFVYVAQVCFSPTSVKNNNKSTLNLPFLLRRYVWKKEGKINGYSSYALGIASPQAGYMPCVALTWCSELHGNLPSPKWLEAGLKDPPECILIMTASFSCTFITETLFYWLKTCCYVLSCIVFTEMRQKSTILSSKGLIWQENILQHLI